MLTNGWNRPQDALAKAVHVLAAPLPDTMDRLSAALADLVPHVALARLSNVCAYTPTQFAGDEAVTGPMTSAELGGLSLLVSAAGGPWQGEARLGGVPRPVLAVGTAAEGGAPWPAQDGGEARTADSVAAPASLLVVVRASAERLDDDTVAVVSGLWDLVTVNMGRRTSDAE